MKAREIALLLACGIASTGAAAQTIYTCNAAGGGRGYQDAPCASTGMRPQAERTFATPRDAPDAARRLEAIDRQVHAGWERDRDRWAGAGASVRRRGVALRRASDAAPDARDLARQRCQVARDSVDRMSRGRHAHPRRGEMEQAAVDACFAL
ncbi:MAG: hypothetical protein HOQ02_07500 [Lysobacter sp.]|nr:hypothetical protein [Lysobacter sp.]